MMVGMGNAILVELDFGKAVFYPELRRKRVDEVRNRLLVAKRRISYTDFCMNEKRLGRFKTFKVKTANFSKIGDKTIPHTFQTQFSSSAA